MGLILNPGAYGPLPTFFNEKQEIDYESYEKHLLNLARRGITNAGGLDMSSAVIEAVIRQAPNLCGVKLTCGGSVSKLVRLSSFITNEPGGHGTVSGIPNFAPAASMRLWSLLSKPNPTEDERQEADRIQSILSNADVAAVPAGVRGMSKLSLLSSK
ncbi:dihydrodipicolinate synthetase [Colletotrichum costaricense]|uniref:Dihydrodipicolinate synthetase n=1 Tax=Colletotrichum costaricense TaxID=1209916 RepID=A0AAI9Z207_9PEZI|nr:dihydrodipicolinate synthetase [Colletotrichum costaricense]KAK1532030.1 dihydrodipicolinate synthetase [Colletotrichum costaricense]